MLNVKELFFWVQSISVDMFKSIRKGQSSHVHLVSNVQETTALNIKLQTVKFPISLTELQLTGYKIYLERLE